MHPRPDTSRFWLKTPYLNRNPFNLTDNAKKIFKFLRFFEILESLRKKKTFLKTIQKYQLCMTQHMKINYENTKSPFLRQKKTTF